MIISGKGISKGKRIDAFVQHEDFVPTILDLIGIKYEEDKFDGRSLVPVINGKEKAVRDFVFMEESAKENKKGIRTKEWKYIEANSKEDACCNTCNEIHGGVIEIYNLKNDKEESNNLANENNKKIIEMKIMLETHIKMLKRTGEKRVIKNLIRRKI